MLLFAKLLFAGVPPESKYRAMLSNIVESISKSDWSFSAVRCGLFDRRSKEFAFIVVLRGWTAQDVNGMVYRSANEHGWLVCDL